MQTKDVNISTKRTSSSRCSTKTKKIPTSSESVRMSRSSTKSKNDVPRPRPRKANTAPDISFPPLGESKTIYANQASVAAPSISSKRESKRKTAHSDRSRITLDSIPEHEPLTTLTAKDHQHGSKRTTSKQRHPHLSASPNSSKSSIRSGSASKSNFSRATTSSSLLSSRLPFETYAYESRNGAYSASTYRTSTSYRNSSRMSTSLSSITGWDEHEGRPAMEKFLSKTSSNRIGNDRTGMVECTIKPATLKALVRTVSQDLNTKGRESKHLDSTGVGINLDTNYSMRRHQQFTNLKFAVEESASKARLRSSLYKTEESQRRPTIFRSNLMETKRKKSFNPRYHGEITRPTIVDKHAHKYPSEERFHTKWVPKLNVNNATGPWTTYISQ
ncbi:unnamed protein product [Clavelina lepadiformis]